MSDVTLSPADEIWLLTRKLNDACTAYYHDGSSPLTDEEFDTELAVLRLLEQQHPELRQQDSPTKRVGALLPAGIKAVTHQTPMLSLDNCFTATDVEAFLTRTRAVAHPEVSMTYVGELKIDGLSCSLIYQDGALVQAVTRGNGIEGEEITANVRYVTDIPQRLLDAEGRVEVRGEIYMSYATFDRLNAENEAAGRPLFMNPRNTAAGSIRHKDPKMAQERGLQFFAYYLLNFPTLNQEQVLITLRNLGFQVAPHWRVFPVETGSLQSAQDYIAYIAEIRSTLPFPTDGAVLKVNRTDFQSRLGVASRSPRWATAFKFPPEEKETTIRAVTWQVGRHGAITPVAELEPILLAGSLISRATLHNSDEILRKNLMLGDHVMIHKAAEIIPEVVRSLPEKRSWNSTWTIDEPTRCPVCDGCVTKPEDEAVLRCDNPGCPAQLKGLLEHYVSRDAMDIDGLGPALISQLVDGDVLHGIADLYKLNASILCLMPSSGKKTGEKIVANLQGNKTPELHKFLYGLGIRYVGQGTAKRLAEQFQTFNTFLRANYEDLLQIPDIGEATAKSLSRFLSESYGTKLTNELMAYGINPQPYGSGTVSKVFEGKTFVFTGTLSQDRGSMEQEVMKRGGKTSGSVSKNTTYLVAGPGAGSKLTKAQGLGIPVLDEAAFLALLEEH